MLSGKNLTTNQLSFFTAILLALPLGLAYYIVTNNILFALISLTVIFISAFLLIKFVLDKFVYRKIKLIYKYIYQTKASRKEEMYYKYILPEKTLDEVNEDVQQWAEESKAEIELLQSNEAYRKEFLQNLSHEIKTPIFAIQGYVDTLLSGAMDNPTVNKKFLENTSRNVERLVLLVNDIDEITKLESGEQPLQKENFIIQDLIRELFESFSLKTAERNIQCTIKKGCEYPVEVFADKKKIMQVLVNFVENSIKYGKANGSITAGIYNTDGRHVLTEITDDGIGISEEHLPRIFERFYRTDKGRSRNVGGTGLGLAICKHIIEAHGHSIHVRSTPDVGTSIGFTLDARRE